GRSGCASPAHAQSINGAGPERVGPARTARRIPPQRRDPAEVAGPRLSRVRGTRLPPGPGAMPDVARVRRGLAAVAALRRPRATAAAGDRPRAVPGTVAGGARGGRRLANALRLAAVAVRRPARLLQGTRHRRAGAYQRPRPAGRHRPWA